MFVISWSLADTTGTVDARENRASLAVFESKLGGGT
jgi:hypothetical protein